MANEADMARCIMQDDEFCILSFRILLQRQTADEIQTGRTIHQNDAGFNCKDAPRAMQYVNKENTVEFSQEDLNDVREITLRYTKQLCNMYSSSSLPDAVLCQRFNSSYNMLTTRPKRARGRGSIYDSDDEDTCVRGHSKKRSRVIVEEEDFDESDVESVDGDTTSGICDGYWSRTLSVFYNLLRSKHSHTTPEELLASLGSPPGMTMQDLLMHEHHCQMATGIWKAPTSESDSIYVYLPAYARWAKASVHKATPEKIVVKYDEDDCHEVLKGSRLDYTLTWTKRWL